MLKGFTEFVNESADEAAAQLSMEKAALNDMLRIGLISQKEWTKELRAAVRRSKGDTTEAATPEAKAALASPEATRLLDAGLVNVSSTTQISRGNIILGPPDYDRKKDYALGFFPEIRKVRRMTPKTRRQSPYGWTYSNPPQDDSIKAFPMAKSDSEFYKMAMRWVIDHVDLDWEHNNFPAKKRTPRGYFDSL
jgi:GH18 family chitinase